MAERDSQSFTPDMTDLIAARREQTMATGNQVELVVEEITRV